jgi:hypothetical protein
MVIFANQKSHIANPLIKVVVFAHNVLLIIICQVINLNVFRILINVKVIKTLSVHDV